MIPLIIGKGAREHALAWKMAQSCRVEKIFSWPENAAVLSGISTPLGVGDVSDLVSAAEKSGISCVICGPEDHLVDGLADRFLAARIPVFGPVRDLAKLEGSKAFAKKVMREAGIPTAVCEVVRGREDTVAMAHRFLKSKGAVVIKASGLAAGKGVHVCVTAGEVDEAIGRLFSGVVAADGEVVIEERLEGREVSYFCFLGHDEPVALGFARDYKRLEDGDIGPNTGGMGCYAPVPWLARNAEDQVRDKVIFPLLNYLKREQSVYCGWLYIGLMWTDDGPFVIEFNVRLGDPEAQVLAVTDKRDWGVIIASQLGMGSYHRVEEHHHHVVYKAVAVVLASANYPYGSSDEPVVQLPAGILANRDTQHAWCFGGSVRREREVLTAGSGRILTVVARDHDFAAARSKAYQRAAGLAAGTTLRLRYDLACDVATLV